MSNNKINKLLKFCLPKDLQNFLNSFDSGEESSIAKQIPLTVSNQKKIEALSKIVPLRIRYRGSRNHPMDHRPAHRRYQDCVKQFASRVSLYLKEVA